MAGRTPRRQIARAEATARLRRPPRQRTQGRAPRAPAAAAGRAEVRPAPRRSTHGATPAGEGRAQYA
eukprot:175378-Chlamydomonas_euryale.AAC.3